MIFKKEDLFKALPNNNFVILHICNNKGGWGKGFVVSLSKWHSLPEIQYRKLTSYNLGTIQPVNIDVANKKFVVNMIAQDGYGKGSVCYKSLKQCLNRVYQWYTILAPECTIFMPRIGTGLGGGKWEIIQPIIEASLPLPQDKIICCSL